MAAGARELYRARPMADGLFAELRATARLAAPVVLVQVGLYAMGAVDAAFMGRV